MALLTHEELCDRIRAYHGNPDKKSSHVIGLFHKDAEHISMQVMEASAVVGNRKSKHTARFVVYASTPIEREFNGCRIYYLDLEEWTHEQEQPK